MEQHIRMAAQPPHLPVAHHKTEINMRTSPLAKFVGVEEYEAAGGSIRCDLFGKEDEGYMQDAELLESLALEKLNRHVESIKEEGYAWVQMRTTFDYSDRAEVLYALQSLKNPADPAS